MTGSSLFRTLSQTIEVESFMRYEYKSTLLMQSKILNHKKQLKKLTLSVIGECHVLLSFIRSLIVHIMQQINIIQWLMVWRSG